MNELIELNKIRNNFQEDLRNWFDIAHSLIAATSIGADKILEDMESNPDASYTFSVPITVNGRISFASINNLKYEQIYQNYFSHKGAIAELVYRQMIQRWYDFLNQIIEQVVKDHITGIKTYSKIPKVKIEINFNKSNNILEELPQLIRESFDFNKNVDKIKDIEVCLEQKIDDEELKKQIKKAIIVRNLMEHNQGIVREQDIKQTGNSSIKLIDNSGQEKDFKSGEKVEITIYELYRLKQVFYNIAKKLIPD